MRLFLIGDHGARLMEWALMKWRNLFLHVSDILLLVQFYFLHENFNLSHSFIKLCFAFCAALSTFRINSSMRTSNGGFWSSSSLMLAKVDCYVADEFKSLASFFYILVLCPCNSSCFRKMPFHGDTKIPIKMRNMACAQLLTHKPASSMLFERSGSRSQLLTLMGLNFNEKPFFSMVFVTWLCIFFVSNIS